MPDCIHFDMVRRLSLVDPTGLCAGCGATGLIFCKSCRYVSTHDDNTIWCKHPENLTVDFDEYLVEGEPRSKFTCYDIRNDERKCSKNGTWFIHWTSGGAGGRVAELEKEIQEEEKSGETQPEPKRKSSIEDKLGM